MKLPFFNASVDFIHHLFTHFSHRLNTRLIIVIGNAMTLIKGDEESAEGAFSSCRGRWDISSVCIFTWGGSYKRTVLFVHCFQKTLSYEVCCQVCHNCGVCEWNHVWRSLSPVTRHQEIVHNQSRHIWRKPKQCCERLRTTIHDVH